MALKGIDMCMVLVFMALTYRGAMAQSSCTNSLTSLAPCMNYVTGNSTAPTTPCCSQLASVVQASPQCLCQVLNSNGINLGITINQTLALSLPGACKVQTPPITQCKAATAPTSSATAPATSPAFAPETVPVISPANSPADSSNTTPEPAIVPSASRTPSASGTSGTGSKTVPTQNGTSDANSVKAPLHIMLFVLFITLCGSTVNKF